MGRHFDLGGWRVYASYDSGRREIRGEIYDGRTAIADFYAKSWTSVEDEAYKSLDEYLKVCFEIDIDPFEEKPNEMKLARWNIIQQYCASEGKDRARQQA